MLTLLFCYLLRIDPDVFRLSEVQKALQKCRSARDTQEIARRRSQVWFGSLLQFFKKHSRKATTVAIELKPLTNKERTSSIKPSPPSLAPSRNVTQSKPKHPLAPPKRPRGSKNRVDVDSAHLQAPAEITASDLGKRSSEFRVAHVRYFKYCI